MGHFPLFLDVGGRRVVIVGGGVVGTRRALAFAGAGAAVEVVSPQISADLAAAVASGAVVWHPREYRPDDLADAWLVHTATGEPAVDAQVSANAAERHLWCIDATDARRATAHVPARRTVDDITISVHTGTDPHRARRLADQLAAAARSHLRG